MQILQILSATKTLVHVTLFLLVSLLSTALFAQTPAETVEHEDIATITVYNRDVATLRTEFLGGSPSQRAQVAEQRINDAIQSTSDPKVTAKSNSLGSIILIDGKLSFIITPDDTDKLSGESLEVATATTIKNLNQIIAANKESSDSKQFGKSLLTVAIATSIMLALFWLLNTIKWSLIKKIANTVLKEKKHFLGLEFLPHQRLYDVCGKLLRITYWLLVALLIYTWLGLCLEQFPYTRPWGQQLQQFLINLFAKLASAIIDYMPHLVTALAIFVLTRTIIGISNSFFDRIQRGEKIYHTIDAELANPTRKIVNAVIWIFGLVMAYPYLPGSDSEAFKGISVLIGLMISLGATNIIGQGASGLIITFTRTFRVGEYVRIGDNEGTVTELGMFTTRLRTGMGEEISLSNSLVFGAVTKNYSRAVPGSGYILDTVVTIGYDTPWRQVEAMLLEAAQNTSGISKEFSPKVFQTSLSDFYPEYRLVCYASPEKPLPRAEALSALHANIQDVFNKYGVQIMSPHYMTDPSHEKIVGADRKYLSPAKPPE